MQYLTLWDLVITPVYLIILIFIARKQRDKRYPPGHPLRRYFLPGLYIKFGGAIFIAVVFQFYYGYGDTFNYFEHAKVINSALDRSMTDWWKLIMRASIYENPSLYRYVSQMFWYTDPPSYSVCVITAVLGLLSGTTYIPIALLFASISYSGIWAMFRTFAEIYPKLHKQLAIVFLFIPSTFVWGSGIFKDTVCMFALGWMVHSAFRIFISRDLSLKNFLMIAFSFYMIAIIKLYILLAFIPALSFWILSTYSSRIRSTGARLMVQLMVVGLVAVGFLFFAQRFSAELNKYSLENIAKTAEVTRTYIGTVTEREGGSAYDLGEFDGSLGGMLTKFPAAVVVTLFRPFLWEAGKVIVMLSALEALVLLYFTVRVFIRNGLFGSFRMIGKDPNILFCLIFSLIFAFAVGISSYNFGALSRYKIPCLPFYGAFLVLLYYSKKPATQPVLRRPAAMHSNT
jgi:hypothetical protein